MSYLAFQLLAFAAAWLAGVLASSARVRPGRRAALLVCSVWMFGIGIQAIGWQEQDQAIAWRRAR